MIRNTDEMALEPAHWEERSTPNPAPENLQRPSRVVHRKQLSPTNCMKATHYIDMLQLDVLRNMHARMAMSRDDEST